MATTTLEQLEFLLPLRPGDEQILTLEAIAFLAALHRRFHARRAELLAARHQRQKQFDAGARPDFLPETRAIREGDWKISPVPHDLLDRRVEITGPVDRKMIINALNSGASVFMADFEDSNTPTWANQLDGQRNLYDAVRRSISYDDPASGKQYRLNPQVAVLMVRPRGWHLQEGHVRIGGEFMSGSLFDFAFYAFHNAAELLARGAGPYFYLPKMESHLEARLWNEVFLFTEEALGIPRGSIKATVLIETIPATFELHEVLYELREHSAGLNCGRWDYIFSFIKKFARDPAGVLPDRALVTMTTPFLRSYSKLVIQTCHRRGAHAMGGMAAFIPVKNDAAANEAALTKIRADKEREASDGHDGTWVAHPALVPVAREVFDRLMPGANQLTKTLPEFSASAHELLQAPQGAITEAGVRQNVSVALGYLEAWFRGIGCVPLFNLMEDAATAEISRAQLWQWVHHGARMQDGRMVELPLVETVLNDEVLKATSSKDAAEHWSYKSAATLLRSLIASPDFAEFLTLPAYRELLRREGVASWNEA